MKTEIRYIAGKIETRKLTAEQKASGYIGAITGFVPYDSDSKELRDGKGRVFVERLSRGVFAQSLGDAARSVVADVGHNDAAIFARRGVNLDVSETDTGLSYTALLPDTTVGRDLHTNVRLGIIEGTSFEFELREAGKSEAWEKRDGLAVRTIKDAILHRVNPVSNPAYFGTSLEARSAEQAATAIDVLEAPPAAPAESPLDTRLMEQRVRFL